ncbi:serine/threonine protein kinase [Mycobacteriaceae bacterium NPDC060252]
MTTTVTISGLPYYEPDFNADGSLNDATGDGDGGLPAAVAAGGITDLFVMSHGWNNSVSSARQLYTAMFSLIADQLDGHTDGVAVVGINWPSVLLPDDDPDSAPPVPSTGAELAAALAPRFPGQAEQLKTMGELLDEKPQQSAKLIEFHTLASGLVTTKPQSEEDSGESSIVDSDPLAVFGQAAAMAPKSTSAAQGLGNPFAGLWSGAREILRTMSYYEMKNRAGVIGERGLGPLMASLSGPDGAPRIHLIGHSFGARLVSYALAGLPKTGTSPVKSLTLIQGAFSHFTFNRKLLFDPGRGPGGLAGLEERVDGPLLTTYTAADRAVGWWYPAASMLARQDSQAGQDLWFRWGAMGHDGYQQDPAATALELSEAGKPYDFQRGHFYRLDANKVIDDASQSEFSGAHSDIKHPEVAWAIVSAARAT